MNKPDESSVPKCSDCDAVLGCTMNCGPKMETKSAFDSIFASLKIARGIAELSYPESPKAEAAQPTDNCDTCREVLEFPDPNDPMYIGDSMLTSKCRHVIRDVSPVEAEAPQVEEPSKLPPADTRVPNWVVKECSEIGVYFDNDGEPENRNANELAARLGASQAAVERLRAEIASLDHMCNILMAEATKLMVRAVRAEALNTDPNTQRS